MKILNVKLFLKFSGMPGRGQEVFPCVSENKKGLVHSTWKGVR